MFGPKKELQNESAHDALSRTWERTKEQHLHEPDERYYRPRAITYRLVMRLMQLEMAESDLRDVLAEIDRPQKS